MSNKKINNIALGIEYNGNIYCGWQKQNNNKLSIQSCIEKAISIIANEYISIYCAGRTDAKVHALGQVIHFKTYSNRKISAWITGVNTYLPKDIVIVWAKKVNTYFHARFSAITRRYLYIIYNNDPEFNHVLILEGEGKSFKEILTKF